MRRHELILLQAGGIGRVRLHANGFAAYAIGFAVDASVFDIVRSFADASHAASCAKDLGLPQRGIGHC
jgi:hypothetical protein